MAKWIATHPLFHVPTARASLVNTGQEWCWIWRDGASPKSSLPLGLWRLRSRAAKRA